MAGHVSVLFPFQFGDKGGMLGDVFIQVSILDLESLHFHKRVFSDHARHICILESLDEFIPYIMVLFSPSFNIFFYEVDLGSGSIYHIRTFYVREGNKGLWIEIFDVLLASVDPKVDFKICDEGVWLLSIAVKHIGSGPFEAPFLILVLGCLGLWFSFQERLCCRFLAHDGRQCLFNYVVNVVWMSWVTFWPISQSKLESWDFSLGVGSVSLRWWVEDIPLIVDEFDVMGLCYAVDFSIESVSDSLHPIGTSFDFR